MKNLNPSKKADSYLNFGIYGKINNRASCLLTDVSVWYGA